MKITDGDQFFICLLAIFKFFINYLLIPSSVFDRFFIVVELWEYFKLLIICPFIYGQIVSQSVNLFLIVDLISVTVQKLFSLAQSHLFLLLIYLPMWLSFVIPLRSRSCRVLLTLSLMSFYRNSLISISLIHFELPLWMVWDGGGV